MILLLVMGLAACGDAAQPTTALTQPGGPTPAATTAATTSGPTQEAPTPTQEPGGATQPPATAQATTPPTAEAQPGEPITRDNLTAANVTVGLELVASGFVHPLVFTHANEPSGRMYIADQTGVIYVMAPDGTVNMDQPFLDLRDRMVGLDDRYDERGLLGLAFHPLYAENALLRVLQRPDPGRRAARLESHQPHL
jgi:hypothetical protein